MYSNRHNGDTDINITMSFASSQQCTSEALILEDTQDDIIIPATSPPHSHQLLMKSLTKEKGGKNEISKDQKCGTDKNSSKKTGTN